MEAKYTVDVYNNSVGVEVFLTTKDITALLERGAVGMTKAGMIEELGGYDRVIPALVINVREA